MRTWRRSMEGPLPDMLAPVSAGVSLYAGEHLKRQPIRCDNHPPPLLHHRRLIPMQFSSSLLAPHQLEARARILDGFKRRARLQVHMACGTGKTRLAQGVAAALGARSIVIFLPSLALVSQTLQAWVSNAELDLERVLCVCSDESVATLDDEHEVLEDLPVAVTTSPEEIALKVGALGRDLIVLCT
ncbi:hypothetical protein FOB65_00235 (plasmid) [Pseudomonas oryzihabitans]|nr:hypothetical protein FOB65_00235 [Pseudomonas oryzihabitans]